MPPALAAKSIDGYCVAEPFNALGEVRAGGKMLRMTGDVWKGHPCCVVVMHEADTMDPARAAWAQGVHNAIVKAQIHLVENREAMAEMLSKDGKGYLPFPKEVVRARHDALRHPLSRQRGGDQAQGLGHGPHQLPGLAVSLRHRAGRERPEEDRDYRRRGLPREAGCPSSSQNDLVNYAFIKKALDANPKWKNDKSVPKTGDPFVRTEVVSL